MIRLRQVGRWRSAMIACTLACASLLLTSCGGDDGPTSPSGGGSGGPIAATITITASGVSPKNVTIAPGSRVSFVNNDTRSHQINSDPHPTHGDCPAIDDVSFISNGQTKTTGNFTTARVCGYHDHNLPDVTALQGTITVQ
jgi:plastocyanin